MEIHQILGVSDAYPLKMDGWKTILSFWDGLFSGAMLVAGTVLSRYQHTGQCARQLI